MRFKKYRDVILGVAMLLFGCFYLYSVTLIKVRRANNFANSRFMPIVLGCLMVILSVIILIQGIKRAKAFDASKQEVEVSDNLAITLTFALIVGYIAILKPVGFLISSIAYLFLQMMVLSPKEKRKPIVFIIVSVAFTVIVYFAFRYGLDLLLPMGILEI